MKVQYQKNTCGEIEIEYIKECPFCQNEDCFRIDEDAPSVRVSCRKCGGHGPYARGVEGAVNAWNKPSIKKNTNREQEVLINEYIPMFGDIKV